MKTIILITNLLLISTNLLFADTKIVGYEYITPKTESAVVSAIASKSGTKIETERYQRIEMTKTDPTLDSYASSGKAYKVVVKETYDRRPNGIAATFTQKEGNIPADLNYSTAVENQKAIEAEKNRLKAIQEAILEEQAKTNLGL